MGTKPSSKSRWSRFCDFIVPSSTTPYVQFLRLGLVLLLGLSCAESCDDAQQTGAIAKRFNGGADLILGPYAESRVGDYVLDNGLVRFAFQRPSSATGWGVYGGSLVDIDAYDTSSGQAKNDDRFQELFVHCNLRAFKAKSASIVSSGGKEEAGVLRITGTDGGFPLFDSLLPSAPLDVEFTLDLKLSPNSRTLEMTHTVKDLAKAEPKDIYCGLVLIPGDQYWSFVQGKGRKIQDVSSEIDTLYGGSVSGTSFAIARAEGLFDVLAPRAEVIVLNTENRSLLANDQRSERYLITLGMDRDIETAISAKRAYDQDSQVSRDVQLSIDTALPLELLTPELLLSVDTLVAPDLVREALTEVGVDDSGKATLALPDGSYQVRVFVNERLLSETVIEVNGPVSQKIEVAGIGAVRLSALARYTKWGDVKSPVKLSFLNGHDASLSSGVVHRRYAQSEDLFLMPAGDYTLVTSKGPEFEFDVQNVTITEGIETALSVRPEQSVDSTGWASGDYHVHGARSMDSTADRTMRVIAAVAEGLDILVATDHDVTTDYGPYAEALGLSDQLHTVPGVEISPLYGHMNAYPLPVQEKEPYWNIRWWEYDLNEKFTGVLTPADLVKEAKNKGAQIVAVNHPRDNQAVFDYLRLDERGLITGEWPDFDAFELMNDTSASDIPQLLKDWMALFGVNRRLTAMGVSDSHDEFGLGYSRTYIKVGNDEPDQIDETELWANLKAGQAVATTGPFVVMTTEHNGKTFGIGDTLALSNPVTFDVKVYGPSWMKMKQVRLMENGVELESVPFAPMQQGGLRLQHTFTATPAKDSLYFLMVDGVPGENHPLVIGGEARAITNPIFVDYDGGGFAYKP